MTFPRVRSCMSAILKMRARRRRRWLRRFDGLRSDGFRCEDADRATHSRIPLRRCKPRFAKSDSAAKMQTALRSDGFRCEDADRATHSRIPLRRCKPRFAKSDSAAKMQTALRSDGFRREDADRASQRRIQLEIIFIDPKLASASLWFFHLHQRK